MVKITFPKNDPPPPHLRIANGHGGGRPLRHHEGDGALGYQDDPVYKVAKRYEISGVALAKVCRKLAVPLPPRGHWTLVELNKAGPRPPLPPYNGQARLYVKRRREQPNKPDYQIDPLLPS